MQSIQAIAKALSSPWAITESGLEECLAVVADLRTVALQLKDGTPLQNARRATVRDGVAVVPVSGPLSQGPSIFSFLFGSSDYETIGRDLRQAMESSEVHAIVLNINSPGGMVAGCGELASLIADFNKAKPIIAYVDGSACSAAYWIASACERIVADPTAIVGSIGTKCTLIDNSKLQDAIGIKPYEIVSSQSPLKVIDAANSEDRDRVRAILTAQAEVFVAQVAKGRGVSTARVLEDFGKGDVLVGAAALGAGMIDALGTFESVIAEMNAPKRAAQQSARANTKGIDMSMKDSKCDRCERDMDDDDDVYCAACNGPDKEASAAVAGILAATDKKSITEALATIAGWKQAAGEIEQVKAALAAQAAEAKAKEFDAALAEATLKGAIPTAPDHPRRKYALGLKSSGVEALNAYVEAIGTAPTPSVPKAADKPIEKSEQDAAAIAGISPEQLKVIQAIGVSPEKFIAHKQKIASIINPVEEN